MKQKLQKLLFGKSTLSNGLIALMAVSLIVLGCTCNGKKINFDGASSDSENVDKVDSTIQIDDELTDDSDSTLDTKTEKLIKDTLRDFTDAVDDEDFGSFLSTTSKDFQYQFTKRKLKREFNSFIIQKKEIVPVLREAQNKDITITSKPEIKQQKGQNGKLYQIMYIKGEIPTEAQTTYLDLQYVLENKRWKLLLIGIVVR